jgi:voltage-gated potassium channel
LEGFTQAQSFDDAHGSQTPLRQLGRRLRNALLLLFLLIGLGTSGYYLIGQGKWKLFDCFYMTVISVTTVGYGETIPVHSRPFGGAFTVTLLMLGIGVNAYFISALTAFFLSEELESLWWRRNMSRLAEKQSNHVIVCGGGETGIHILKELNNSGWSFVLIDDNPERARGLHEQYGTFPILIGDATEEIILQKAGIERAFGLVAVLPSDKDNLFITITARRMNPRLKIVSKGIEANIQDKLKRAGADRVVSPNYIGGVRIASEVVRPHVVQFLDLLTKDNALDLQIEEVTLPLYAPYIGKRLRDTDLRAKHLLVLAVHSPDDDSWIYNPPPDYLFESMSVLIVLGESQAVEAFRKEMEAYEKKKKAKTRSLLGRMVEDEFDW